MSERGVRSANRHVPNGNVSAPRRLEITILVLEEKSILAEGRLQVVDPVATGSNFARNGLRTHSGLHI